ncbi:MAG TPA: ABC transporter permease [Solirubrobacterales bacterium]|nr:ABC transporter permease [Solirubrobacterales bacterium]
MRWLLLKDLQILRRSPLQAALLVIYPILIAVLVGFALSRDAEKPRVAFLNLVPQDTPFNVGQEEFDIVGARSELCDRIDCVRVHSREQALEKVRDGDVLGALILPEDLVDKLESLGGLNPEQPTVEVIVNEEDPVQERLVDDRISTLLAEANLRIAREVVRVGSGYLDLILNGGDFSLLGASFRVLGLAPAAKVLKAVRTELPPGPERKALDEVIRFSDLARENLTLANPILTSIAEPIKVDKEVISGDSPPLDVFAIAVAATITLMFVTVLLVAGSLALEREENAFARVTRSLVSRAALLTEKISLGIVAALVVTLLMLAGLELFLDLHWERLHLWVVAILAGGAAFAAAGAALGVATREVRAASLLAFMLSLPLAFLSLVPSGAVSGPLEAVIDVVAAVFPFEPALDAMSGALDATGPDLGGPLLHLAALTAAYALLARLAMRRFTAV